MKEVVKITILYVSCLLTVFSWLMLTFLVSVFSHVFIWENCFAGNTCFMNSVIQVLRFTPQFLENLSLLYQDIMASEKIKRKSKVTEEVESKISLADQSYWCRFKCLVAVSCILCMIVFSHPGEILKYRQHGTTVQHSVTMCRVHHVEPWFKFRLVSISDLRLLAGCETFFCEFKPRLDLQRIPYRTLVQLRWLELLV